MTFSDIIKAKAFLSLSLSVLSFSRYPSMSFIWNSENLRRSRLVWILAMLEAGWQIFGPQ